MQSNDESNPAHQMFNYDTAQASSSSTSPPGHNPQNIPPNGYPGFPMNPMQPGSSGIPNFNHSYHVPGASNHPHFHPANLASAGYMPHGAGVPQVNHQGHGELHPWYQGYHPSSANHYCMQNDQYNMWHHVFPSDYMDIFSGNVLQNHQSNHQYGQNANRVLPSPNSTSSVLSRSGPSSPEMELRPGSNNNFPGDPRSFEGAQGIRGGEASANRVRNPGRPGPVRADYEWMNRRPYQSAQNNENSPESDLILSETSGTQETNGKTRTKDKYRVVYSDNQRMELEKVFTFHNKYITIRQKSELAVTLGLSERQVKIWFQNRRAKERKQTKKRLEEKAAQEARHISPHNFPNLANFAEPIRNPQMSSATALALQQNQSVNVLTSGGLLTPPTASEDVLAPSCSYATPHLNPQFKKESDDHSR